MMGNPVSTRFASEKDAEAIVSVLQLVSQYSPPLNTVQRALRETHDSSNVAVVVAEIDSRVIGCGCLFVATKIRAGKVGYIEDVAVLEEHQCKGVGLQLVQELVQLAKLKGCYKVSLESSFTGMKLYEKAGFQQGQLVMKKFLN